MPWNCAVRKAGDKDFNKDTPRFGLEVYRDDNTGDAIYISQTGLIGVVPGLPATLPKIKDPAWLHGVEMQARKAGDAEFKKDTKRYGLEIYRDENSGNLVYITELGAVPAVK